MHLPPPVHGPAVMGQYIRQSSLINDSFRCRYINLGLAGSVNDIGRGRAGKLFRYAILLVRVTGELLFRRPDLCYITPTSHGPGFYKDFPVIALARLFGVRRLLHFHNKGVRSRDNRYVDDLLYRFAFKNASVILLSKYLYHDISRYVPEERVSYCPNGIPDAERMTGRESEGAEERQGEGATGRGGDTVTRRREKQKGERTEILFLSHLIKSKGVLVLLDACKILKEAGTDFHCTIAGGEGDLTRRELEGMINSAGLRDNITVTGERKGEEKRVLMQSADIFVHPTYEDCQPLVLLEAMQYSLPVVSTHEGAIPGIVEEGVTGYMVPQRDAVALADRLRMLAGDPWMRERMGAGGRDWYEREFTIGRFEVRMYDILKEKVKRKK